MVDVAAALEAGGLTNPHVREYVEHWAKITGADRVEVVGQFGVEEVIGVAVHQQHCTIRAATVPRRLTARNEGGDQVALPIGIGAEGQRLLPIAR